MPRPRKPAAPPPRRKRGTGTISQRPDGLWRATIQREGRRVYLYDRTEKGIIRKLDDLLAELRRGEERPRQPALTLGGHLDNWLAGARPTLRAKTAANYESLIRRYLEPLKSKRLSQLTAADLRQLYAALMAQGLAALTVKHLHSLLHTALAQAERDELVRRNVAHLVTPPRGERYQAVTLTADEARRFLEVARESPLYALFVLVLTTGMREGELLGLRWQDVDLDRRIITLRGNLQRVKGAWLWQETKTRRGRPLPLTGLAVDALRAHSRGIGAAYIFTRPNGQPIHNKDLLKRHFHPLLERARLPPMHFHDLRHSVATLLVAEGVHARVISSLLGHSQIGITMDLYAAVLPSLVDDAVSALDRLFTPRNGPNTAEI